MHNDLAKITADNAVRRAHKDNISPAPWTIYKALWFIDDRQFVAFARSDNAEDVIDSLVEEVVQLRANKGEQ